MRGNSLWPELPLSAWSETCDTLHLWTQIVGKVRLATTPLINHWWNVTLQVNARGLVAPANSCAERSFDIVFDFVDHQLGIATCDGRTESLPAAATELESELRAAGCTTPIQRSDLYTAPHCVIPAQ
jgi:uncharacterized protein DUF5996